MTVMISIMNFIPMSFPSRKLVGTEPRIGYVYLKDGALDMDDFRAKLNERTNLSLWLMLLIFSVSSIPSKEIARIGSSARNAFGGGWELNPFCT